MNFTEKAENNYAPSDGNTEPCGWCNKPYDEHVFVNERGGDGITLVATLVYCRTAVDKYGDRREYTPERVDDRTPEEARAETMGRD